MKRFVPLLGAIALSLAIGAPVLAQDPAIPTEGAVHFVFDGDYTLAAGDEALSIVVVQGDASVEGTARDVTVLGGTLTLRGTVETLTIIDGRAELESGSRVLGDVAQLSGVVDRSPDAYVGGSVTSIAQTLAPLGLFLGGALILFWIGTALMLLLAGLALAAFAARQVRAAERVISGDPVKAFVVGLLMIIVPPLVIVALALTIVGLPLALSLLLLIWPTLAFVGYLVAAIWIGDWLLTRTGRTQPAERPYLAAFVGLIVAGVLGLIPIVGAVISIFGLGAVTIAGWRVLVRRSGDSHTLSSQPVPLAG